MKLNTTSFFILIPLTMLWLGVSGQNSIPENFCLSNAEIQLFEKINELRLNYEKEALQLSTSLSFVAKTHVNDLQTNHPDTSVCNLSSWSDKGIWSPCCYNSYIPDPDCMWDKPKELTNFTYRGYELVVFFDDSPLVDSVITLFSESKEVLDMILTQGNYKNKKWVTCGVGLNEHYVSIWFAQRKDPAPTPVLCDQDTSKTVETGVSQKKTTASAFYLIVGSYTTQEEAKAALRELRKNDFKESGVFTKSGKSRVYIQKFNSLKEAMLSKDKLPSTYSDAWILKE